MEGRASLQRVVSRFSIGWLVAANAVGVWLAALLIWPELGKLTGSIGYGRWMPLHMDWQLYGWCSLPLLGLLLVRYLNFDDNCTDRARTALWVWSSALLVGGASWLLGEVTGKPFLNWTGFARWYFAISLGVVWGIVALGWWKGRNCEVGRVSGELHERGFLRALIVLALGGVPLALFFVSDASVYPPVDPDSGGATGHSLLASTLGIVGIMGVLPSWGLELGKLRACSLLHGRVYWGAFALSVVVYLLIQHGNASNRAWDQIVGLGSLLVWPVLIVLHWRAYEWSDSSKIWRRAFFCWWGFLVLNGWLTFLPGILDTLKFTNALVAHTHLAMAGMVTALNMVILSELGTDAAIRSALSRVDAFWIWNAALLIFVVALTVQGMREGVRPEILFQFDTGTAVVYWLRLLAGVAMLGSSVMWGIGVMRGKA